MPMSFPITRMRRLRRTENLRSLVRETRLAPENLVLPLFVCPGEGVRREVKSMPGVANTSVDEMLKDAREAHALGLGGVILFGIPSAKDERGSEASSDHGIVQQALRALKRELPKLVTIADVCLCEYTSHGHCGVVEQSGGKSGSGGNADRGASKSQSDFEVKNDETLEL